MSRVVGLVILVLVMVALGQFGDGLPSQPGAEATLGLGFVLLAGWIAGKLFARLALPMITGYLAAGILFGPHLLGFLSRDTVADLQVIDKIALALIALTAGGEIRMASLRRRLPAILAVSFSSVVPGLLLLSAASAGLFLLSPLHPAEGEALVLLSLLLGLLLVTNSPATVIAVISESRARGDYTETVLGVAILVDVFVILLFSLITGWGLQVVDPAASFDWSAMLQLLFDLVLALVLGAIFGKLLALYIERFNQQTVLVLLGYAYLVSMFFHEELILCITTGFVIQNYSKEGGRLIENLEHGGLPVYVVFFALAGAALDLSALALNRPLATLLVLLRLAVLFGASWTGDRLVENVPPVRRWMWAGFLAQAGVSLALLKKIGELFADQPWVVPLSTLALAVLAINQVLGPIAFKVALSTTGEAGAAPTRRRGADHP